MADELLNLSKEAITIPASPAKAFFVAMITRDIELQDAILDLLDNCIDGVRRMQKSPTKTKPFKGYYAKITLSEEEFVIEDNCGGISLEDAQNYALMMGRPSSHKDKGVDTIGVYGIGMKRAIFKMGRDCVVHSHHREDTFEIRITEKWLKDDDQWALTAVHVPPELDSYGTRITIKKLNSVVRSAFTKGADFFNKFPSMVVSAYSFLMEKGFSVSINGQELEPELPKLLWDTSNAKNSIRPYIYDATIDGVKVFMAVGFREPPNTSDDDGRPGYSSEDAGWSIVCNDRVTLPYDRGIQTGWGWGGVPSYHTQFIAISGFVLFEGNPKKLPMTTTKRGVDANSPLYTTVRQKMQEGILHFIAFTNEWKGDIASTFFKRTDRLSISEVRHLAESKKLVRLKGEGIQKQLVPHLPTRPDISTTKKISFTKSITDIETVSEFLFGAADVAASEVGSASFNFVLRKAGDK